MHVFCIGVNVSLLVYYGSWIMMRCCAHRYRRYVRLSLSIPNLKPTHSRMQRGQRYHNHRTINTNTPSFAQIHVHDGNYRRIISIERLTWLWKIHLTTITTNTLTLSPPTQDFATKVLLNFKFIGLTYSRNWARIDLTNIALAIKTLK